MRYLPAALAVVLSAGLAAGCSGSPPATADSGSARLSSALSGLRAEWGGLSERERAERGPAMARDLLRLIAEV